MIENPSLRADLVYDAEWAAGVAAMRPFTGIADLQLWSDAILREEWWEEEIAGVQHISWTHIPSWDRMSACHDKRTTAKMELTIGNICEGTGIHELSHCARGDVDNGHWPPFLRAQVCILDNTGPGYEIVHRYVRALLDRELLTGRERWLKDPAILRPAVWAPSDWRNSKGVVRE